MWFTGSQARLVGERQARQPCGAINPMANPRKVNCGRFVFAPRALLGPPTRLIASKQNSFRHAFKSIFFE